jgi:hypothetical protein
MEFRSAGFGPEVKRVLALDGGGYRLMPLAQPGPPANVAEARRLLSQADASRLFPRARAPLAALSGLWLYFSCLDESHSLSQQIETSEGSFWHAVMHRQEPDPGNSGYWFRRVGQHPIFPLLASAARAVVAAHPDCGFACGERWDPFAFIDFVEAARRRPGSEAERAAREIQLAEWQLLFHHCAEPRS